MKQGNNGTSSRFWNNYNRVQDQMLEEVFRLSRQQRKEAATQTAPVLTNLPQANA